MPTAASCTQRGDHDAQHNIAIDHYDHATEQPSSDQAAAATARSVQFSTSSADT